MYLLLVLLQGLADQLHISLDLLPARGVQFPASLLLDRQVVLRVAYRLEIRLNIVECRKHLVQLVGCLCILDAERIIFRL